MNKESLWLSWDPVGWTSWPNTVPTKLASFSKYFIRIDDWLDGWRLAAIESLTKNKTVIMIAHRLKTVKNCDNIFVVNDGKIVQSGKHDR
ncbi:MAG: hypothetical protein KIG16_00065 [Eubacteriales bacterium]|nr:hypothetical protein [Eubacteriales bacterium]